MSFSVIWEMKQVIEILFYRILFKNVYPANKNTYVYHYT